RRRRVSPQARDRRSGGSGGLCSRRHPCRAAPRAGSLPRRQLRAHVRAARRPAFSRRRPLARLAAGPALRRAPLPLPPRRRARTHAPGRSDRRRARRPPRRPRLPPQPGAVLAALPRALVGAALSTPSWTSAPQPAVLATGRQLRRRPPAYEVSLPQQHERQRDRPQDEQRRPVHRRGGCGGLRLHHRETRGRTLGSMVWVTGVHVYVQKRATVESETVSTRSEASTATSTWARPSTTPRPPRRWSWSSPEAKRARSTGLRPW